MPSTDTHEAVLQKVRAADMRSDVRHGLAVCIGSHTETVTGDPYPEAQLTNYVEEADVASHGCSVEPIVVACWVPYKDGRAARGALTIVVGVGGLISPERATEIRRLYFTTPERLYTAGAIRIAMGLIVLLPGAASRAPKLLRVRGGVMCMQGLSAILRGPEHARTVLEWEATQGPALLRVGALVALVAGMYLVVAVTGRRGNRATSD